LLRNALKAARAISFDGSRARALAALAPHLPETERPAVLRDALEAARAISDNVVRAHVLAALAPHLPETERPAVLRDALETARAISDDDSRARALAALAPRLPETLLRDALEVARAISDDDSRARALAALAPLLPEPLLNRLEAAQAATLEKLDALRRDFGDIRSAVGFDEYKAALKTAAVIFAHLTTWEALRTFPSQSIVAVSAVFGVYLGRYLQMVKAALADERSFSPPPWLASIGIYGSRNRSRIPICYPSPRTFLYGLYC
jgi:hypothetical protein